MSDVVCPRCQSEIDPAVKVCPNCGASENSTPAPSEVPWRQQIRDTVQRRKELRQRQLARREEEGRQLSIFPEAGPPQDAEEEVVRRRREEIRARVEQRLAKPRSRRLVHAGEVSIPSGAGSAMAVAAPELDTELPELGQGEVQPRGPVPDMEPVEPASPGQRILSGLIDMSFVSGVLSGLLYVTARLVQRPLTDFPPSAVAALGCVGSLLAVGYFLFFWSLSGQTLGNLLTGTRVVALDGRPLGAGRAALRVLGLVLSWLPLGVGFVGVWSDPKRRAWHDRLASTTVVRA
ncbi:MAG: RDD family protein [Acidobacteriota bacterium]